MKKSLFTIVTTLFIVSSTFAQESYVSKEKFQAPKSEYSPYINDYYPKNVYFGDTHLHTSWSTDAGMVGARLGPDEAYRAARGEEVTSYSGWKFKLIRPLDFIVVADHAENLGLADFIRRSDPIILANKTGKKWHDWVKSGNGYDAFLEWLRSDKKDLINEPIMMKTVWAKVVKNADKYYQPKVFTTFHAYEWTSMPDGNNLHRVVIFRDSGDKTSQTLPYSMYDSVDPEDLWKNLADYEKKTNGRVLAIAHNGNLSNGLMFDTQTYKGKRLTTRYAQKRSQYEPLYEVTQMKGDGESHPRLSPDDEFADYENLDAGNISGKVAKTDAMLPKEYARSALKEGLRLEKKLGVNPFKFGLIGSTDAHGGLPSSREENNFSKAHIAEPAAGRAEHFLIKGEKPELSIMVKDLAASGLAAVWASENTRESIWDAMARKEVYATTGSRLKVRVFGGWDFNANEVHRPDFAREGYARGVPMGGDLTLGPKGEAPKFMIRAIRDADGANIDRVQVIKGWLDNKGKTHERIYDVAVSGERKIGKDGRSRKAVGSTVDIADASYTNTIGEPVMEVYWSDPDFDAHQKAFYYVRVIEIPTPRWTAYDAKFFNVKMPVGTKMTIQDRAYTSPIWYTPSK
ncbi:DUF3604 domain-containing protein [bacterium AH-315-K03]|nr:DUF3604 domain-containing protein [bacterium AH-315-K03]